MQPVRCSNCQKIIGEMETGKVKIKCPKCKTFTTFTIEKVEPEPRKIAGQSQ